jgi:uncharacterized protein (DUF952 family)
MALIYKICAADLWRAAERAGAFTGGPVDQDDGFIHFSTAAQVRETAAKHFRGRHDLLLIAVDADALGAPCATSRRAAASSFRISTGRCRSRRCAGSSRFRSTGKGGISFPSWSEPGAWRRQAAARFGAASCSDSARCGLVAAIVKDGRI